MTEKIITGREEELEILRQSIKSKQAEFIALYGRRRVGKTFLVRNFFSTKGFYLEATGIKDGSTDIQLENFMRAFSDLFHGGAPLKTPAHWREAFQMLTERIQSLPKTKKFILFLDELPWMATLKSGLVQAIDYYWNKHWSAKANFILITCGSAASWMLDHLIFATGGLYNRVTKRILLEPFNLKETALFLAKKGVKLKPKFVLDLYMVMGGIPFYLNEVQKGKSVPQTIDRLCFHKKGLLYSEFTNLFRSLFDHGQEHQEIVRAIAKAGGPLSRDQIIQATNIPSGGAINRRLEELEASSFIQKFIPYGKKRRDALFRIIDEYTLFYLRWMEPLLDKGAQAENYWQKLAYTPQHLAWSGLAFESVCIKHINQIARSLDLDQTAYVSGSWHFFPKKRSEEEGAQIDWLFDRGDGVVTLCEIKYSDKIYVVDKAYAKDLDRKIEIFSRKGPSFTKKKHHSLALITTFGVKKNMYSEDIIENIITLEDFF